MQNSQESDDSYINVNGQAGTVLRLSGICMCVPVIKGQPLTLLLCFKCIQCPLFNMQDPANTESMYEMVCLLKTPYLPS